MVSRLGEEARNTKRGVQQHKGSKQAPEDGDGVRGLTLALAPRTALCLLPQLPPPAPLPANTTQTKQKPTKAGVER